MANKDAAPSPKSEQKKKAEEARQDRLREQLRANLRRRKDQNRARQSTDTSEE